MLPAAVEARKGLLVQQQGEIVASGHLSHRLHDELVLIARLIGFGELRREFELARSDFIVSRVDDDAVNRIMSSALSPR